MGRGPPLDRTKDEYKRQLYRAPLKPLKDCVVRAEEELVRAENARIEVRGRVAELESGRGEAAARVARLEANHPPFLGASSGATDRPLAD